VGYQTAKDYLSSKISGKTVYLDIDDVYTYDYSGTGSRLVCVVYVRYNSTHRLNVNKALLDQGLADLDNYYNEFNPSTWSLYVRYASDPPAPPPSPPSSSNKAPIAIIEGPKNGTPRSLIQFSGSKSYDPDGSITRYFWTFGDDKTSIMENPTHTYAKEGEYLITLRVIDNKGRPNTATFTCTITNPPNKVPIAKINGPTTGIVNQTIHFTSIGTYDPDGNIKNYYWQFGDNSFSTLSHPEHTYREAKKYQISLSVEDYDGAITTVYTYCTIIEPPNDKPIARIDVQKSSYINQPIQFWGNRSSDPDGSIVEYIWSFGDGTEKQEQNPIYSYRYPSNYTVRLKVTDNMGKSSSTSTTCTIEKPPNLSPNVYLPSEYIGTTGEVINFMSNCSDDGFIIEYHWDFGNGISKNLGSTASLTYETEDEYNVTLTVTDNEGATSLAYSTCTIVSEIDDQESYDLSDMFLNLGLLSIIGLSLFMFRTRNG